MKTSLKITRAAVRLRTTECLAHFYAAAHRCLDKRSVMWQSMILADEYPDWLSLTVSTMNISIGLLGLRGDWREF